MPVSGGTIRFDIFLVLQKGVPTLVTQRWQHTRMDNSWRMASESRRPAEPGDRYDTIETPIAQIEVQYLNDWFSVLTREDFEDAFAKDPRCKGPMSSAKGKYLAHFQKLNKLEKND